MLRSHICTFFAHGATIVNDRVGVYLARTESVDGWWYWNWGSSFDGCDECFHLGLIHGSLSGLDIGDRCQHRSNVLE